MSTVILILAAAFLGTGAVQIYNRGPGPLQLLAAATIRVIAARLFARELAGALRGIGRRWPECVDRARRSIP